VCRINTNAPVGPVMKEENVSWDDSEGRSKLIMRKLNDPDFKKLRIVEGRV
jgi:hypothetical protein